MILQLQHSGKARKGDGNDLTPNPRKLQCIGRELDKLGRTINQMTTVNESPFKERPKLRKEKNKLASRACRLKKKAQHEANKIKLHGLETEHSTYFTFTVCRHFKAGQNNRNSISLISVILFYLCHDRTIVEQHRKSKESLSLQIQ